MTIKKTWLNQLSGFISDDILLLKDERGQYYLDRAHEKHIKYITNNLMTVPWRNQLIFGMVIGLARNLDVGTINTITQQLNSLFKPIYKHFALDNFDSFIPDEHLHQYAYGDFTTNSVRTRSNYLNAYFTTLDSQKRFIRSTFDEPTQKLYEKYMLPLPSISMRDLNKKKKGKEESERIRKEETDAVMSVFAEIRAEAHIRFNQVIRLKKAFDDAVSKINNQEGSLPLEFHYEESGIVGERWYFKLWDKASFDMAHPQAKTPVNAGQVPYFLEFLKAEKIESAESVEAEGLWFFEPVKLGLLKQVRNSVLPEQKEQASLFFKKWGYIDEDDTHLSSAFYSQHAGVLTQKSYLSANQNLVEGILIDVEPIFASVHFGMLALETGTTSGARINELLQINYTKDCMVKVKNPGPPPVTRYVLRMVPKGKIEAANFYVTEDVMKIITFVVKMLKQHYQGSIPNVKYGYEARKHLFADESKPYVFQYRHRALDNDAINASVTSKDSSNPNATKASELKVKNPTLIEISNGSISQYIEGEEKVIDYLS